jgi:DNA invertase Pin-like site-specific DNA recombinase
VRRYELNDKSASKGEQQEKLNEMLADMREGTIKVLVCWRSNRLERRGVEALFKLLSDVKKANGRVESTTEPLLGTADISGEATTALGAIIDHQFSVKLSEDTARAITQIKASGHVYNGNVGWGFDIVGPKYGRTIVPTDECREYAPEIFRRCIKGESLRQIAAWLDSEGVQTARGGRWNEGSVRWIIRNRVYAGRLLDGSGQTILECEAVVDQSIWDRANTALRNHPKRGPIAKTNRPLLANLKCARCEDSPMYRIFASRGHSKRYFYRCTGRGPQRKGCGNMVPLDWTDDIVFSRIFIHSYKPHQDKQWVDGKNWDDQISNVKQDIREATEAERFTDVAELAAKLADLRHKNETDSTTGHYEYTDVLKGDGTVMTEGEYYQSLDLDGKREYLKTRDIRVEKAPALDDGTPGIHLVIDGVDAGVYYYGEV